MIQCIVLWVDKDQTQSVITRCRHAAETICRAVSSDLKDEAYIIVRESEQGTRWNHRETVVFRSGVRIS